MKKLQEIMRLRVVDEQGKRIGKVSDVCFGDGTAVCGIQVERRGLFAARNWIGLCDVKLIGEHSVIVRKKPTRRALRSTLQPGQRVFGTDGTRIGILSDALIDEHSGAVEALQVSRGYIDDVQNGREWVRRFILDPKTETIIAVTSQAETELESESDGG